MSIMPAASCTVWSLLTIALAAGLAHTPTQAQPMSDRRLTQDQFQRVEQGRGDQGPLDGSLLAISRDLRVPNDFSGVYRISPEANSRYAGRFARMSGGVIAVFPQSVYQATRRGIRAPVPPGTEFFIGGVPTRTVTPSAPSPLLVQTQAPSLRVDTSVSSQASSSQQQSVTLPAKSLTQAPTQFATSTSNSLTPIDPAFESLPRILGISALGQPIESEAYVRSTHRIMHDATYRGRRLTTLLTLAFENNRPPAVTPAALP